MIKGAQAHDEKIYRETGKKEMIGLEKFFDIWKMTPLRSPDWMPGDLRKPGGKFFKP